jgi:hypothetical protein
MARSLPNFGVPVLFVLLLLTTGCNNTQADWSLTGPAPLEAAANIHSSFRVEASTVDPEFFHSGSCVGQAFGARVGIRVHGDHDVILRGLRFTYVDPRGVRSLPDVLSIPSLSTLVTLTGIMPNSSPVSVPGFPSLPNTTLIPIPGSSSITGVVISAGSSHLFPFFVNVGCGFIGNGVIVIVVDAGDRDGRFSTSELKVVVRGS